MTPSGLADRVPEPVDVQPAAATHLDVHVPWLVAVVQGQEQFIEPVQR
jgi:hypothetical protein